MGEKKMPNMPNPSTGSNLIGQNILVKTSGKLSNVYLAMINSRIGKVFYSGCLKKHSCEEKDTCWCSRRKC